MRKAVFGSNNSESHYSTIYNEGSILWEYRGRINDRILAIAKYSCPAYLIIIGGYFMYSDFIIRDIGYVSIWRIPSLLLCVLMLVLLKSDFRNNITGIFIYYNVFMFSASVMLAGITYELYDTPLFKTAIIGMLAAVIVVYMGTYGGFRILLINYIPIPLSVIAIYFKYHASVYDLVEFGNVIGVMGACLTVSQSEENLRYGEFRFAKIAEIEKEKSNSLLLNILPPETAEELKLSGKVIAKKIDSATVLFTDFKGFTQLAEAISPEKLVHSIDYYFSAFDKIIDQYGLEKIKTIGDAYMCAGGISSPSIEHPVHAVKAAVAIRDFVSMTLINPPEGVQIFEIRIGIHTGPVVAGVVGIKKFQYDIWGDTVNLASRMETASEAGEINLSEVTYNEIKDHIDCTHRGEISIKNHGSMKMYFVDRR